MYTHRHSAPLPETEKVNILQALAEAGGPTQLGNLGRASIVRMVNGKETANYWDIEKPKFAIEQGPAWLKIDSATGVLSGTPDAASGSGTAGKVDVAVTVTIDQDVRTLDDGLLGWGNEKVTSISTERVGSATRRFSIEVGR